MKDGGDGIFPRGMIFANHLYTGKNYFPQYINTTFAVSNQYRNFHRANTFAYMCSSEIDTDRIISSSIIQKEVTKTFSMIDIEHPTFTRMVEFLKNLEYQITVFNGKRAIILREFIESYKSS